MARMRTLKPEFFRSKALARCSLGARLTFMGLWGEADDFGRGEAEPRVLAGAIWPLDDDMGWEQVEVHLLELANEKKIVVYEVDGDRYYEIPSWEEHQAAAYRRGKAIHPAPLEVQPAPTLVAAKQPLHDEKCKGVQGARLEVLELGTGNGERGTGIAPKTARARDHKRDELFDALVDVFGSATTTQRKSHYGKCVSELLGACVPPGEVRDRGKRLKARGWDNPSPEALLKWWDDLTPESPSAKPPAYREWVPGSA